MESTTNYDMFKDVTSNREVDKRHVKSLVKAIRERNLLHVSPILVSKDMSVIDGQHRLEAAKILGVPIYYIVGEVERKDISKLNSHQKNWKIIDYINYHTIEKIPEFVEFSHFYAQNSEFSVTGILSIMSPRNSRGGVGLKNGSIDIDDKDRAQEVIDVCKFLNDTYGYEFVYDAPFLIALKKAMFTEGFELEILYDKIGAAPRAFVPCRNMKEYIKMIEDVYNYRLTKNEIRIK